MSEPIRVTGFRKPRMPRPPRRVAHRVLPVRLMNLLWTVPLIILPALTQVPGFPRLPGLPDLSGTPHLLLFYTSTGQDAFKYYIECAYLGLDGGISHLSGSSCPYVRFFKDRRS